MTAESPFAPPRTHPVESGAPPATLDLESLDARARIATIAIAATAGLGVLVTLAGGLAAESDELGGAMLLMGLALALLGVAITGIVTFLMWLKRASLNARALHPEVVFETSLGWTTGWWFVPLMNLFRPARTVHEIWHWSSVEREAASDVKFGSSMPPALNLWWAAWIGSMITERIAQRVEVLVVELIAAGVTCVAAVLCIKMMKELNERQHAAAGVVAPRAPW